MNEGQSLLPFSKHNIFFIQMVKKQILKITKEQLKSCNSILHYLTEGS